MNEAKIEELGAKPLQDLISDVRRSHTGHLHPFLKKTKKNVEQIVCIPLVVCLNTSDWGMGSD